MDDFATQQAYLKKTQHNTTQHNTTQHNPRLLSLLILKHTSEPSGNTTD
jgi:hypothetical protein